MRYAHNIERVLAIPSQAVAVLATLMLRGPQTVGELRTNCERLHRFADTSALEAFLAELSTHPAGALVAELPRQPGARENRWAHLLSGPPVLAQEPSQHSQVSAANEFTELKATVNRLEDELAELKLAVAELRIELGRKGSASGV